MLVVMTDGSSKGNPGPIKIAFIIWDRLNNAGRFSNPTHRFSAWHGAGTNNEAEYEAMIAALEFIVKKYPGQVQRKEIYFYSDSQLMIKQINGHFKIKEIRMLDYFNKVSELAGILNKLNFQPIFSWVPRQLIELADKECQQQTGERRNDLPILRKEQL